MQQAQSAPYLFTAIDSGVDWITCTAAGKGSRRSFQALGQDILRSEARAGVEVTDARLRDYVGSRVPGVFIGSRADDDICVLSGAHAARLWKTVARASTNVSRLDLQVTVWTHGEQPALSRWYYQRVRRLPPKRGRPRSFSLIQSHPHGDTLYVGKRQSDCYGRVYDWATAHSKGAARTLWRYEVEYKRHLASMHAHSLLGERVHPGTVESIVAGWYEARGVRSTWLSEDSLRPAMVLDGTKERDVLSWFESSLSKTVAKAVERYGVAAVLDSLHLSDLVIVKPRKEDSAYANLATTALRDAASRRNRATVDHHEVLVQRRERKPR